MYELDCRKWLTKGERYDRPGKKMVRNLWNPLSPMHYEAVVNLSKDAIYQFMNKTVGKEK